MRSRFTINLYTITLIAACIIGSSFGTTVFAARKQKNKRTAPLRRFPNGCTETGHQFKLHVLALLPHAAGKTQSLYFIHNTSNLPITLYQMRTGEEPFVLHLNNTIRPNQWGVLATDEPKVSFICTKPNQHNHYGSIINCKRALQLCEYVNVKFAVNNGGNYWAVRSTDRRHAINSIIHQGILLRW